MQMGNASKKIKKLCAAKGITIKELGEMCGYSDNYIYNTLRRDRISKGLAEKIVEIYPDVLESWLLDPKSDATDFMTDEEVKAAGIAEYNDGMEKVRVRMESMIRIAETLNYKISLKPNTTETVWIFEDQRYTSSYTYECSPDAFKDLYDDLIGYIEFRLNRFAVLKCKRGENNG